MLCKVLLLYFALLWLTLCNGVNNLGLNLRDKNVTKQTTLSKVDENKADIVIKNYYFDLV